MTPLLQVKHLVTEFHTQDGIVHAVNGVSFDLEAGETLAIVGESGCGKSVTVLSLLGLIPRPPGRVLDGQALFHLDGSTVDLLQLTNAELRDVRGKHIGMVFQDPLTSLNPVLTIGLQIAETLMEHIHLKEAEARERAIRLLELVGIPEARERYDNFPHQFSGGMRQRVMFAIAIACSPKILIADEPTTALDVTVQAQIVDLAMRLRKELGMAVIWITHDLGVVAGLAQRIEDAAFLYDRYNIDVYCTDSTEGPVINGQNGGENRAQYESDVAYWATKGFYTVLDALQARIPGFKWENCACGAPISDFGAMKRSIRLQCTDVLRAIETRRAFHDASFFYPPVQISGVVGGFKNYPDKGLYDEDQAADPHSRCLSHFPAARWRALGWRRILRPANTQRGCVPLQAFAIP